MKKAQNEMEGSPSAPVCRFCGAPLGHTFVDLGMSPLCESFLSSEQLNQLEPFFPLHAYVCARCFLVQLEQYVSAESIFREYAYFSSYSDTWLQHSLQFTEMAMDRFRLSSESHVVEIASNDGYLLQYFVERNIPALGIEPAANVARTAATKGVPTLVEFFGTGLARQLAAAGRSADLLIGNNVLAQVPDLNDFVEGMAVLLKPQGTISMEFPHLLQLMTRNQFDTIYHEHFSYFSFRTVERIFAAHGLELYDVEELPTHGGSLRIFARHADANSQPQYDRVQSLRSKEDEAGLNRLAAYDSFGEQVRETKRRLLSFLIDAKRRGKRVAGYGAPGKGNTLLNYCGIRTDFLDYTVDRNPYKQGKFLPGTHIPIFHPDKIRETRPDFLLILPWNFREEIIIQNAFIREWGGKFAVPIPELTVID